MIVEVFFAERPEITGDCQTEWAQFPCKFSIHFYLDKLAKIKLVFKKKRQLICCLLSLFYLCSVMFTSVIIIAPFIESLTGRETSVYFDT